jgi:hypothetical protein
MPGKGELLVSPDQAAIGIRVADEGSHVRGDLGQSVDQHGAWLAVAHASALKDVSSVLVLVKEEVIRPPLYSDLEKWWRGLRSSRTAAREL